MVGQIFRMLMPQEPKPSVSTKARVDTLVGVPLKATNSSREIRPTSPIFRKVAA